MSHEIQSGASGLPDPARRRLPLVVRLGFALSTVGLLVGLLARGVEHVREDAARQS